MNDKELEDIQQSRNLTAPRVTLDDVNNNIGAEYYTTLDKALGHNVPTDPSWNLGVITLCVLVLRNGFVVIGEAAPASPDNFDAALGQKIAKQKAIDKVWPLMGYALKDRMLVQSSMVAPKG